MVKYTWARQQDHTENFEQKGNFIKQGNGVIGGSHCIFIVQTTLALDSTCSTIAPVDEYKTKADDSESGWLE